jgi:hypothetical protein
MKTQAKSEGIKVKGCYRLQIEDPDGEIVGDSGWNENTITNIGFQQFLAGAFSQLANSSAVGYMALGTGSTVAVTDTNLSGELAKRSTTTAVSSSNSKGVMFTATFNSSASFLASGTSSISNVGLFASSTLGTICAGNTYASSSVTTNQNVNASYSITFT